MNRQHTEFVMGWRGVVGSRMLIVSYRCVSEILTIIVERVGAARTA